MINEFTLSGMIVQIGKDDFILLEIGNKNYVPIKCETKIKPNYLGEVVEVSGYLKQTNILELVGTKIIKRG